MLSSALLSLALLPGLLLASPLRGKAGFQKLAKRQAINCETDANACPGTGPSGAVVTPVGGTTVSQTQTYGGDGLIPFNYTTVNIFPQSGAVYFTQNVNITLEGNGKSFPMALIGAPYSGANIVADLITPFGACGTFNLVVEEQQYYAPQGLSSSGSSIKFRAAAPEVIINCVPFPTGTVTVYTPTSTAPVSSTTSQSILTGVTLSSQSSQSILTGVVQSTTSQSILTGVVQSTSDSILTGVVQSQTPLTGVVQSTQAPSS